MSGGACFGEPEEFIERSYDVHRSLRQGQGRSCGCKEYGLLDEEQLQ